MIDTVKCFNIIPCDITQFLLKFLYGLITDISFQNVLLCFDVNINVYFSNKKYWKMIRNIWPFGNLGIGISASTSTLTSASPSALQSSFFSCKVFILPFEVSYVYGEVLFKYPSTPSWEFQPLFRAVIL